MMVVSWRLGACPARSVPATPNGCSAEHGSWDLDLHIKEVVLYVQDQVAASRTFTAAS